MPMMPPSLSGQPPMGASPISVPSGSPGATGDSFAKMREAVKLMQEAINGMPPGSEPHKATLSAIQGISKFIPPSAEVPGVQQTALRGLQQKAGQNPMLQQIMSSLGGGGQGANAGGGGAAMPPGMAA